MFRVLAAEDTEAVVLNYAPGPLDTPMIENLLADARTVPGKPVDPRHETQTLILFSVVRTMFEDLKKAGGLIKPANSAARLVALLRRRNFKSGDHVDYYDEKLTGPSTEGGGSTGATPTPPPSAVPLQQ